MKKITATIMMAALLVSCGGEKDPKAEVTALKAQLGEKKNAMADLKADIEKIENDIAKLEGKKEESGIPVQIMKATATTFKNYLEVMGRVDAEENVNLSSEMMGTVTRIHVQPGDVVSKGQVLAETDNQALAQNVADLQVNLDLVNTLFEKQKSLWDQKIGTEVQYLQLKNQKESLEKKMAAMKEQMKMTKIISPINGTVDAVDIKIGQAIMPGLPAIRVVNFNNLRVKAEVAEKFAPLVKTGSEVRVIIPDMNDSVDTKVSYAARAINTLNRTFTVEVSLAGNKEYHPNMFSRLKITTYVSKAPVISIPTKLVQRDGSNQYVMIANGKKTVKKVVTTGQTYNGTTEILGGINEGDLVISNGHVGLLEGDVITYKN